MKIELSKRIFRNYSNIKFHENPPVESRVVPCGRTDMTDLIVAFRNYANASQNNTKSQRCAWESIYSKTSPTMSPDTSVGAAKARPNLHLTI